MSGFQLGDLVLDSSHVLFVRSLQALVCSRFFEPLAKKTVSSSHDGLSENHSFYENLELLFQKVDQYQAKACIFLEKKRPDLKASNVKLILSSFQSRNIHIHLVSKNFYRHKPSFLEFHFGEVHQELVWGNYRFLSNWSESLAEQDLNLLFGTIIGAPSLVSDGLEPLPLFVKGGRRCFWMPSFFPHLKQYPVSHFVQYPYFPLFLEQALMFGVHNKQKILPLGKVQQFIEDQEDYKSSDPFHTQSESFKTHEW